MVVLGSEWEVGRRQMGRLTGQGGGPLGARGQRRLCHVFLGPEFLQQAKKRQKKKCD